MVAKPRRVLAVATYFPEPQDEGDPIRVSMMLRSLAPLCDLTVLATLRSDTTPAHVERLADSIHPAELRIFKRSSKLMGSVPRMEKGLRGVRALIRICPPWVLAHRSAAVARSLRKESAGFDQTLLLGEAAGQYIRHCRSASVVWDKSNVLTASNRRNAADLVDRSQKLKSLASWPLAWAFERRALRLATEVWVTSDEDARSLAAVFNRSADQVIRSAAPKATVRRAEVDPRSNELFWMSSLSYPPNFDGLVSFLDACAPTMTELGLSLRVAGSGGSAAIQRKLESYRCVNYLGFVDDLTDAASGVAMAIIPLWAGAGVKLKTLTLAQMGLPILATPQAMESLDEGLALDIVDNPEGFMRALAQLDGLRGDLLRSGERAFELATTVHSEAVFADNVKRALGGTP